MAGEVAAMACSGTGKPYCCSRAHADGRPADSAVTCVFRRLKENEPIPFFSVAK
jgi:hypothetical protein